MPQPEHISPSAYEADKGPTGVLLIHGLGGSAAETRPMGEYLARHGVTVRCPLLSGHGTNSEDLSGIRWQEWAGQVNLVYQDLQVRCHHIFVGGLSMGALLALWLGAHYPEIAGLVLMTPGIKLSNRLVWLTVALRHLIKYLPSGMVEDEVLCDPEAVHRLWCYDRHSLWGVGEYCLLQRWVRRNLNAIQQPLLMYQGRHDNWLAPEAAQIIYDGVSSAHKRLVWLERSGHNVLVDGERETVWAQSYDWMMGIREGNS